MKRHRMLCGLGALVCSIFMISMPFAYAVAVYFSPDWLTITKSSLPGGEIVTPYRHSEVIGVACGIACGIAAVLLVLLILELFFGDSE